MKRGGLTDDYRRPLNALERREGIAEAAGDALAGVLVKLGFLRRKVV